MYPNDPSLRPLKNQNRFFTVLTWRACVSMWYLQQLGTIFLFFFHDFWRMSRRFCLLSRQHLSGHIIDREVWNNWLRQTLGNSQSSLNALEVDTSITTRHHIRHGACKRHNYIRQNRIHCNLATFIRRDPISSAYRKYHTTTTLFLSHINEQIAFSANFIQQYPHLQQWALHIPSSPLQPCLIPSAREQLWSLSYLL